MPRRPFTKARALAHGITPSALRWGLKSGRWQRIGYGVMLRGGEPPSRLEHALGVLVGSGGVAAWTLAGILHGLDSVVLGDMFAVLPPSSRCSRKGIAKRSIPLSRLTKVEGYPCTDGLQTILDLAAVMDDVTWEQALESVLRKALCSVADIEDALPEMSRRRDAGVLRIKRVLALRPSGAPPTESLLETLMIQLIRSAADIPTPERQVEILNRHGDFVARVDLAWPDIGVFVELDGQQHKDQPVYEASRETAAVAATGWLPARFTWHEVTRLGRPTLKRLREVLAQRMPDARVS